MERMSRKIMLKKKTIYIPAGFIKKRHKNTFFFQDENDRNPFGVKRIIIE